MGKRQRKFVGKAIPGEGWRVWNKIADRWWGLVYSCYPTDLLNELNGKRRNDVLAKLQEKYQ